MQNNWLAHKTIPNMHTVKIQDSEKMASNYLHAMKLGKSAEEAFPNLLRADATNNAYSLAMGALEASIHWVWLCCQAGHTTNSIVKGLEQVITRVGDVHKLAANQGLRRLHDLFLLQASIISGNTNLMQLGAELAGEMNSGSNLHSYEWGLIGVYKNAILENKEGLNKSALLMATSRPSPPYRMPSRSVVKAFAEENNKNLSHALRQSWKREWQLLEVKENGVLSKHENETHISLKQRGPNNLWPWPEVSFAILATKRGMSFPRDPLWCPPSFCLT